MANANGILNHYIEAKKIIAEARKDGQLVIFVGAGTSISSGMPTWFQAIRVIASHLGKVRKIDECISELYGEFLRMRTLVSGVEMPFTGVFVFPILLKESFCKWHLYVIYKKHFLLFNRSSFLKNLIIKINIH